MAQDLKKTLKLNGHSLAYHATLSKDTRFTASCRGEGCKTYTEEAWIDDWVMLAERYRDKGLLGRGVNPKPYEPYKPNTYVVLIKRPCFNWC